MRERRKHLAVFLLPGSQPHEAVWRPLVDVYRLQDGWLLKFDLAGVRREDVEVRMTGCSVTVAGIRRDWVLEQGARHYSMEISYSRFERTVELPCELQDVQYSLEYRDGILFVRMASKEGKQ